MQLPGQSDQRIGHQVPADFNGWYHGKAVQWKNTIVSASAEANKANRNLSRLRQQHAELMEYYK